MKKRWTANEVARLFRDIDRDLAKGLTIADVCRKIGLAETTYYRWRQRHDPAQVDTDRRCRELEAEVKSRNVQSRSDGKIAQSDRQGCNA